VFAILRQIFSSIQLLVNKDFFHQPSLYLNNFVHHCRRKCPWPIFNEFFRPRLLEPIWRPFKGNGASVGIDPARYDRECRGWKGGVSQSVHMDLSSFSPYTNEDV